MTNAQERRESISVPVDPAVLVAIKRVAKREDRTLAAQVRHRIASGLANQPITKLPNGLHRRLPKCRWTTKHCHPSPTSGT